MPERSARARGPDAVRTIAVFEAAKGILVVVAGFGLLTLVHRDAHELAARLIAHAHLNPASHYPRVFLDVASAIDGGRIRLYAAGAALYAAARLVEAYGLWRRRGWAEWFAAISAGLYVPIEIVGLVRAPGWLGAVLLLVNLMVVAVMLRAVRRRRAA